MNLPILSLTTFFPLIGVLLILKSSFLCKNNAEKIAKYIAIITSTITFILSLVVLMAFDKEVEGYQLLEFYQWIPGYDINYKMGVDGISVWFVVLTGLLTPICVLCSWNSIEKNVPLYMSMFLVMETFMIGVFCALDFLVFYLFFEAVLIPMFIIIGVWGGDNRIYAAFKFFLYTLIGSVLLLVGLLYIYLQLGTTDMEKLVMEVPKFSLEVQKWLFLAFFASFAVKVPMWPFHTWLPDAHVQAPTAGSVVLAGVLLKIGGYGFLRFSLPMLPEASTYFAPYVFILSLIAIVYTSLVALVQTDMKKLIAYSSVAHMGYVTLGIFTFNQNAIDGAVFQMISHGLVSAALFLCVGVLYDRMHTKEIALYGGLVNRMPSYAMLFMIFTMASVGLPTTSGFVGEFLVLLGAYAVSKKVAFIASTGVVLGAAYMLWLYRRVVLGEIHNKKLEKIEDVNLNEKFYLTVLAVLAIIIGIYPNAVLKIVSPSVETMLKTVKFIPIAPGEPSLGNIMYDTPSTEVDSAPEAVEDAEPPISEQTPEDLKTVDEKGQE